MGGRKQKKKPSRSPNFMHAQQMGPAIARGLASITVLPWGCETESTWGRHKDPHISINPEGPPGPRWGQEVILAPLVFILCQQSPQDWS